MDKNGVSTERCVINTYKGYTILKITKKKHSRRLYGGFMPYSYSTEVYYIFCKIGNEKKPSQYYEIGARSVEEVEKRIDEFIEDDTTAFTEGERNKYVDSPNRKCRYEYGYTSFMKIMREHKKSSKRKQVLLEDRLSDANYHHESYLLSEHKYDEYAEYLKDNYKFREKFVVLTETECKRLENPEEVAKELETIINEYFSKKVGNTTTAHVSFIADWK